MKTIVLACLLGTASAALWDRAQDPQKPATSPAPAAQAAAQPPGPLATPASTKGMPPPNPLEGVYELRSRTLDGVVEEQRSRGYVAITKRHMLVCLVAPGANPDLPLFRAGVRTWKPEPDDRVRTEYRLGFFTDMDGGVHVEPPGTAEVKRIELARGRLRIYQDERSYLEFERIE